MRALLILVVALTGCQTPPPKAIRSSIILITTDHEGNIIAKPYEPKR